MSIGIFFNSCLLDTTSFCPVHPVFNPDALDVLEVVHVLRHHRHVLLHRRAADEQVEVAGWCACQTQPCFLAAVTLEYGGNGQY